MNIPCECRFRKAYRQPCPFRESAARFFAVSIHQRESAPKALIAPTYASADEAKLDLAMTWRDFNQEDY